MSDERLYVIPSDSVDNIFKELHDIRSISSFLLKHFVERNEVANWSSTPIMSLCELYCGSESVENYVQELATNPTVKVPEQYKSTLSEGDVVISNSDYVGLTTLVEGLRTVRDNVSHKYGVSFEVH